MTAATWMAWQSRRLPRLLSRQVLRGQEDTSTGAEASLAQTEADRAAVSAVRPQVFVHEQSVPEELEYDEFDPAADHFLALLYGVPAGAGRLVVIDSAPDAGQGKKATGVPGRLAVGKDARGRALGRLLVDAIERRAAERGLAAVELHAQAHARGFYQQLSYAAYGDALFEAAIEHISMRKELP